MRSHRRTHIKLFLLAGFIISLLAGYLQFGLLPGNLRDYAIEKLETISKKKIRFQKVLYLPFQGIIFYHLKVYETTGEPIFTARRFAIDAKILEFFKTKKIILKRVTADTFRYDLVLDAPSSDSPTTEIKTKISGQIDVPVAPTHQKVEMEDLKSGADSFLPENVYLEQIQIVNGIVVFRATRTGPTLETLHSIDITARFHKPPVLDFDGSLRLGLDSYAYIGLKGSWDLEKENYQFKVQAKSDYIPSWLLNYQKGRFLVLEKGRFQLNANLLSLGFGRVSFEGSANMQETEISLKKTRFSGPMSLETSGIFNTEEKKFEVYKGLLELRDVAVEKLSDKLELVEHLKGRVYFEPDLLDIRSIEGRFKDVDFDASGTLKSFTELILDGRIHSTSSIDRLLNLLTQDQKKWLSSVTLEGECDAVTLLSGSLKAPGKISAQNNVELRQGRVKTKKGAVIAEDVSLNLSDDENEIHIRKCRFKHKEIFYSLEMDLPKSGSSPGFIWVQSPDLKIKSRYIFAENGLKISDAAIETRGLSLNLAGDIENLANPSLNLGGTLSADLEKTTGFGPAVDAHLKKLGLRGILSGNFILQGLWNQLKNWHLQIDARSPFIFVKSNIRMNLLEMQVRMKDGILNIPYFHAQPYGGNIGVSVFFDLSKPGPYFNGKIHSNNLDLYGLGRDMQLKNRDFSGLLTAQTSLAGNLNDPKTYQGRGALDIRNGNLWQSDLFKKMGELPFVSVRGFDKVTFTDLSATFNIHDKKIETSDLFIRSETVHLNLTGGIGFDQNLDFLMNIQFSGEVMQGALATGGLVPFVVQEAADFISQYKIKGTLKEPKFEKQPLPTGNIIGKKISGLLQNLTR